MASLRTITRSPSTLSSLLRPRTPIITLRTIHTSLSSSANPISHPAAPGPPPPVPSVPEPNESQERVQRKKQKASLLAQARDIRSAQNKSSKGPSSPLKKRFWKDVAVKTDQDGHTIHLDARPLRTPTKSILQLPTSKRALALAIALEWDTLTSAAQATRTHHIPLTSLTARAMDIAAADTQYSGKANEMRKSIVDVMMRYLATDTLLCWAPDASLYEPESSPLNNRSLRALQEETAKPVISYLTTHVWPGVDIIPVLSETSILPEEQPELTKQVVRGWLMGLNSYDLAGVERAVLATKSLLVGVRLVVEWSDNFDFIHESSGSASKEPAKRFGVEEAAEACTVEVRWQTGQWGEVEDTHDVEKEDLRRQLGSVILLVQ